MVLEKLMEKKDLRIYLTLRIEELESHIDNIRHTVSLPKIGTIFERLSGRTRELKRLLHLLENDTLKVGCKKMWANKNIRVKKESEEKSKSEFYKRDAQELVRRGGI